SIRGGGVLDGTEVLAIFLSRKMGSTIGDVIVLINLIIFLAAAYLLSIETALYSMLTYLAASKTLDFVVEGIEEYTGVTIISNYSEEIRQMIIEKLGRGVTIYNAKGGFRQNGIHNHYEVLYTVITRLEIRKLNIEITKIDSKAFVVMNKLNDTRGGMIKKRIL
ncbi:MAG: YitT family protein, partial [Maribacter sp.]|nr:YitT family protein [Maribacter sp.]